MTISGLIIKETEKAFLLQLDRNRTEWFPKSQIKQIYMGRCDQEIEFTIPTWLAEKKFHEHDWVYYPIDFDEDDEFDHIIGTYFDQC